MTNYYYDLIFKLAKIISLSTNDQSSSYELETLIQDISKFTDSKSFKTKSDFSASTTIFIPKPVGVIIPSKVYAIGNISCVRETFSHPCSKNNNRLWGLQYYIGRDNNGVCSLLFNTEDQLETFFDSVMCSIARMH